MHLVPHLKKFTDHIRLVGRNPKKYSDEETFQADLLDAQQTANAIEGSEVVYLLAGLKYDTKVWKKEWPVLMNNVINGCLLHGAKLVFLDNVYMYGLVKGPMTEETPFNPCSRKGEIRAALANLLNDEIKNGGLSAMIARSADFVGPGAYNTFMHGMIFMKMKEKKKPTWLGNDLLRHSYTFTPDAGRAVALLGNTPEAYGQTWHLPTSDNPLTGKEFISVAAEVFKTGTDHSVMKPWMMQLGGLFNPLARESVEMMYQYTHEYLFDSSKFESRFFNATSAKEAVRATAASYVMWEG